jgi:hypothetical protein
MSLMAFLTLRLGWNLIKIVEIGILTEVGQSLGFLIVLGVGFGQGQMICLGLHPSYGGDTNDKKNNGILSN